MAAILRTIYHNVNDDVKDVEFNTREDAERARESMKELDEAYFRRIAPDWSVSYEIIETEDEFDA